VEKFFQFFLTFNDFFYWCLIELIFFLLRDNWRARIKMKKISLIDWIFFYDCTNRFFFVFGWIIFRLWTDFMDDLEIKRWFSSINRNGFFFVIERQKFKWIEVIDVQLKGNSWVAFGNHFWIFRWNVLVCVDSFWI